MGRQRSCAGVPRPSGALRCAPGRTGSFASASRSACGSPGMASRRPCWPASRASSIAAPAACSAMSIAFSSLPRSATCLGWAAPQRRPSLGTCWDGCGCAAQASLGLAASPRCMLDTEGSFPALPLAGQGQRTALSSGAAKACQAHCSRSAKHSVCSDLQVWRQAQHGRRGPRRMRSSSAGAMRARASRLKRGPAPGQSARSDVSRRCTARLRRTARASARAQRRPRRRRLHPAGARPRLRGPAQRASGEPRLGSPGWNGMRAPSRPPKTPQTLSLGKRFGGRAGAARHLRARATHWPYARQSGSGCRYSSSPRVCTTVPFSAAANASSAACAPAGPRWRGRAGRGAPRAHNNRASCTYTAFARPRAAPAWFGRGRAAATAAPVCQATGECCCMRHCRRRAARPGSRARLPGGPAHAQVHGRGQRGHALLQALGQADVRQARQAAERGRQQPARRAAVGRRAAPQRARVRPARVAGQAQHLARAGRAGAGAAPGVRCA